MVYFSRVGGWLISSCPNVAILKPQNTIVLCCYVSPSPTYCTSLVSLNTVRRLDVTTDFDAEFIKNLDQFQVV